jgi:apolipoprotein N-acyltransferase
LAGALLLSFMLFWVVESLIRFFLIKERSWKLWLAPLGLALSLLYGFYMINKISALRGAEQEVALLQANISIQEKRNIKYFADNTDRYLELSAQTVAQKRNLLIIWPESAFQKWVPDNLGHAMYDPELPYFQDEASFLMGALTYQSRDLLFNSVIAIYDNGEVPSPYHKRVLMSFGEYMPLASLFPWIQSLNPGASSFSSGDNIAVFLYPLRPLQEQRTLKISPLICYEDIISEPARESTNAGAEVLVSLSNDAWYGNTVAPYQHHLIASFRAIENRRFLLRSTNSGLTAIVNPLGQTISQLRPFSEGVLYGKIRASYYKTLYGLLGNKPWWILTIISALLIAQRKLLCKNKA